MILFRLNCLFVSRKMSMCRYCVLMNELNVDGALVRQNTAVEMNCRMFESSFYFCCFCVGFLFTREAHPNQLSKSEFVFFSFIFHR